MRSEPATTRGRTADVGPVPGRCELRCDRSLRIPAGRCTSSHDSPERPCRIPRRSVRASRSLGVVVPGRRSPSGDSKVAVRVLVLLPAGPWLHHHVQRGTRTLGRLSQSAIRHQLGADLLRRTAYRALSVSVRGESPAVRCSRIAAGGYGLRAS